MIFRAMVEVDLVRKHGRAVLRSHEVFGVGGGRSTPEIAFAVIKFQSESHVVVPRA